MRPLLPAIVISATLTSKIDATTAFHVHVHVAASYSDQCHSRNRPFDNHRQHLVRKYPTAVCAAGSAFGGEEQDQQHNDDDNESGVVGLSALPPIGASSFWDRSHPNEKNNTKDTNSKLEKESNSINNNIIFGEDHTTNVASSKFQIQYTCKVCSSRNLHSVTRLAYRKGVVIAMCKGCFCRHLLADNLGWSNYAGGFNFDDGETNIEIYMENKARENRERKMGDNESTENDLVMRVNREVFNLERALYEGQRKDLTSSVGAMQGVDPLFDDGSEMGWS